MHMTAATRKPVIVSYGGGTNSTAMLVGMIGRADSAPHAILFADTGGELPETYEYLAMFSAWLVGRGFPSITIVRVESTTLEADCHRRNVLPAVAYGFKTCSLRFKVEPQEKWCNRNAACKAAWKQGERVTKLIGFDYGELHRARWQGDEKYTNDYPLIEWKWSRDDCARAIQAAGLPLPGKSACFFCPNSKIADVRRLERQHPELLARALAMEAGATRNTTVAGLGRSWAWRDLIKQGLMFPEIYDRETTEIPCECYDGGPVSSALEGDVPRSLQAVSAEDTQ